MTRQESEDCTVPEAPGNRGVTQTTRRAGGGKAVPVEEEGRQQRLNFATAENPRAVGRGAEGRGDRDRSRSSVQKAPKAKGKLKRVGPARMEVTILQWTEDSATRISPNGGSYRCWSCSGRFGRPSTLRRS